MTSQNPYIYPKLRSPLNISIEQLPDQRVILISDPLGIVSQPLGLIYDIGPVLGCFDGVHSTESILGKFQGLGLTPPILQNLIQLLDSSLFLETPKFFSAAAELKSTFQKAEIRQAALAGLGYAASRDTLEVELDRYLVGSPKINLPNSEMIAIVAPHIDYNRGGACYGITYSNIIHSEQQLYIIIGTSHQYSPRLFHLTQKHFDTPLGTLACDRSFVNSLAARHGITRSFQDELLHRKEHSLELQLPFLKRILDLRAPEKRISIVPILVGSFHTMISSGKLPSENEEYESFCSSIVECLQGVVKAGVKFCMLAGVDMAHVGKFFGDTFTLTADYLKEVESKDRQYLDAIAAQDKRAVFSHIAQDGDARRICGFPTMYIVLDIFDRLGISLRAKLLDYRQAVDHEKQCAVTFAGMAFFIGEAE